MEASRKFSTWEQEIIKHLSLARSSENGRIEDLLCSFYFKEQDGRALIIQSKSRYAVFFLSLDDFNDAQKKNEELDKFFEMLSLIRWLKERGYIALFRSSAGNDKVMYFLQDGFQNPNPSTGAILLNLKGDNTSAPDTIHDKNQKVIYKGMVFNTDTYEMIVATTTGNMYVAEKLSELVSQTDEQPQRAEIQTRVDKPVEKDKPSMPIGAEKIKTDLPKMPLARQTEQPQPPVKKKNHSLFQIIAYVIFFLNIGMFVLFTSRINTLQQHMNTLSENNDTLKKIIEERTSLNKVPRNSPDTAIKKDSTAYYYGIDISHWNGNIITDISHVDSISFAICKATEGATGIDPDYNNNCKLIRQKGLIRGKYHFYLINDDPVKQAEHFYEVAGNLDSLDMPLIVDIEQLSLSKRANKNKTVIQKELLLFLHKLQQMTARAPIIYTDFDFANEYLDDPAFSKYGLWLAEYSDSTTPQIPVAWKKSGCKIWQKSKRLDINSFTVDYDVYHGIKKDLCCN